MPTAKKKVEVPSEETKVEETVVETPKVEEIKKEEPVVVKKATPVIFESVDGKKLFVSINDFTVSGVKIEVPRDKAEEAERILKSAKYLFTKIA